MNADGKKDADDAVPWCEALTYCENLSLAGHDDWRLPNVLELLSIVDYGSRSGVDAVFAEFLGMCWSSTSFTANPKDAWLVSFGVKVVYEDYNKGKFHSVRAVRGGR